jgi:hypothetical protein
MGRVTKNKVAALLSNRQGEWSDASNVSGNSASSVYSVFLARYTQLREETGYPVKRNKRMWQNETEIRAKLPPMKLIRVSDEVIVTKVSDLITRFQRRSYSLQQDIPKDVRYKIIQKLLGTTESADSTGKEAASALQEKQVTRRIIEELAVWRPDQLRSG